MIQAKAVFVAVFVFQISIGFAQALPDRVTCSIDGNFGFDPFTNEPKITYSAKANRDQYIIDLRSGNVSSKRQIANKELRDVLSFRVAQRIRTDALLTAIDPITHINVMLRSGRLYVNLVKPWEPMYVLFGTCEG